MKARAVTLALLVVLAGLGALSSPVPAGPGAPTGEAATTPTNDTSMGAQVSSFMQASAGGADEAVASGMWDHRFETARSTEAKADAVNARVAAIERQLQRLRERKQHLEQRHENGTITDRAYEAQMSNIVGRLAALNRSLQTLQKRAADVGANVTRVERAQRRAGEMGREMANATRAMPGGPPPGVPGPPENRTPGDGPGDRPDGPKNRTDHPGNGNGPGDHPGNDTQTNATAVSAAVGFDR